MIDFEPKSVDRNNAVKNVNLTLFYGIMERLCDQKLIYSKLITNFNCLNKQKCNILVSWSLMSEAETFNVFKSVKCKSRALLKHLTIKKQQKYRIFVVKV